MGSSNQVDGGAVPSQRTLHRRRGEVPLRVASRRVTPAADEHPTPPLTPASVAGSDRVGRSEAGDHRVVRVDGPAVPSPERAAAAADGKDPQDRFALAVADPAPVLSLVRRLQCWWAQTRQRHREPAQS